MGLIDGRGNQVSFENVLAKYDTIRKLNELDQLIDEARARKAASAAEGITDELISYVHNPPSSGPSDFHKLA